MKDYLEFCCLNMNDLHFLLLNYSLLSLLIIFNNRTIGIKLTITIAIEGAAASIILSSEAYKYAETERVLKLKGLKISVAGNSFITSIKKTNIAVRKLVLSSGKCILVNKLNLVWPNV